MEESGWTGARCRSCKAGTYSTEIGAVNESACVTCQEGHFSTMIGAAGIEACSLCTRGTISTPDKTMCAACEQNTFCPGGSAAPIECKDENLACNGSHLLAMPGFLAILHPPDCVGAIPCPPGTQCNAHPGEGDGIMERAIGQTHIVVFEDGPNRTQLNCASKNETTYGYSRVDWPQYDGDPSGGKRVLFRLQPEGCLAGSFLKNSICEPCPPGTYSIEKGALDWSDCIACPEGKYTASNGSTLCADCTWGTYQALTAGTSCVACDPGSFQGKNRQTTCTLCQSGKYVNVSGASACLDCPVGTAQAEPGSLGCRMCSPVQFSDAGDSDCAQCWSTPSPETHKLACQDDAGALPELVRSVWITTTGSESDECIGSGETERKISYAGLHEKAVLFLENNVSCKSTLRFMGRPELAEAWTTHHVQLQRPVLLQVIPHNDTFYPAFCRKHGLSVAFIVKDANGYSITNLSDAEAVLSFVDPLSGDLLYWTVCNQLPGTMQNGTVIALGYCQTSLFCPNTDIEARVTLSWPGGGSVQGRHALSVGAWTSCPPSTSWLTHVELEEPGIPFFRGDVMRVLIRSIETPSRIVAFKLQVQLSDGVEFHALSSMLAVSYTLEKQVLTVQGDNTRMEPHEVLCELKLRQNSNATGLYGILRVIEHGVRIQLEDHMSYEALVRTQGFACGDEKGILVALTDLPRITTIVAEPSRKKMIYWKAVQTTAVAFKTFVEAIGIWNTQSVASISMGHAICSSLDPDLLRVESCLHIEAHAVKRVGGTGRITVKSTGSTPSPWATVSIDVLIPAHPRVDTFPALNGLSGRFKVLVRLTMNGQDIFPGTQVDATPFLGIPNTAGVPVKQNDEEWRCLTEPPPTQPGNFTMGQPVLFSGTCTENEKYRKGLVPFLYTGGFGGPYGFVFGRSIIHPKTPKGVLLLFSSKEGLLWSGDTADRGSLTLIPGAHSSRISTVGDQVSLLARATSPRCIPLLYQGLPRHPIFVAVYPAAPASLHVILSTYILVTQHDIGDILPSQADIVEAWLMLSNNQRQDVLGEPRLQMHTSNDLDIIPTVGVKTRTTGGVFSVKFQMEGMHCLSYTTTLRVHPYSIASAKLECAKCPEILTLEDDPLSLLLPSRFLSSIPMEWFVLRCILVDGTKRDKQNVQLTVEGAAEIRDGKLMGVSHGTAQITSPLARQAFQMKVIRRWAVDLELLCNGIRCIDPGISLTTPGNGASLAPFGYRTELAITSQFVLVNHTTFAIQIPSDMILYVNDKTADPNNVPLVGHGQIELLLYIPHNWQIKSTGVTIWIHVLESLRIVGARTLFQVHCSGTWEQGSYSITGKLSDGSEAAITPLFTTDEGITMHFDENENRFKFLPENEGEAIINITHGTFVEQIRVIATISSKYVESVRLDFLPFDWNTPLETPLQLEPVLEPSLDVRHPDHVWKTVLTWSASEEGIIAWNNEGTTMMLLSDYFQSIDVVSSLTSCDNAPTKHFSKRVNVNVMPDKRGQVDLGAEKGPPLPVIAIGRILPIPVYLYSDAKLFAYNIQAHFENVALHPVLCSPGEFPGSTCHLTESSFFQLSGEFYESQRSGRILVGIIHGRVMLDTLSHVQVDVESFLVDNASSTPEAISPYVPPKVFRFAVRTGNALLAITPHQPVLNEINPPSGMHGLRVFLEEDPSSLVVCCNTTVMRKSMRLERVFPFVFSLKRLLITWSDDLSISEIDIMDPRLRLDFDRSLVKFIQTPYPSWEVLDTGDWGAESKTGIHVTYTHPGTLGKLTASVSITLAEVQDIILEPEVLEFRRIHCSPSLFQSDCATPIALFNNGLGEIELKAGDTLTAHTNFTDVITVRISTLLGLQICVNALQPGVATVEVSLANQISKTFQVTVLDESVAFSRLYLPDALQISSCRGGYTAIPVVGYTADGTVMQELQRFGAYVSDAPTQLLKTSPSGLYVSVLDSTKWGQSADTITVTLPACENQSALSITSNLLVSVTPCIDSSTRPADLTTRSLEDGIELSLVGSRVVSFFIHLRVKGISQEDTFECKLLHPDSPMDCAVLPSSDHADILIAGNQTTPNRGSFQETTTPLISLSPRPSLLWGFVEVFAAGIISRIPVDAGRMGPLMLNPVQQLMPGLPLIDASGLQRSIPPFMQGADPLFLLTDRHRLVDIETYSNNHELSIMFRVTNRFLVPDIDTCKITCTLADATGTLPLLPGATRQESGDQSVTAAPMQDGWYVIQTDGITEIPQLDVELKTITVETATSYKPWRLIVDEKDRTLHTGTVLHDCPRTATDKARFMITIRVQQQPGLPSQGLVNALACSLHVVARRISFGTEGSTTWSRLSVLVESFVRARQISEKVLDPSFAALLSTFAASASKNKTLPLLPLRKSSPLQTPVDQAVTVERIMYVEDNSDGNISCPPGTFFSRNGTYQKLPEHAQAGIDCYGMVCLGGYEASTNMENGWISCVPARVSPDIAWICVIVILSLLAFVVCVIVCVKLSRTALPERSSELPASLAGISTTGQGNSRRGGDFLDQPNFASAEDDLTVHHPAFDTRRWGSISEVILDDHSLMMLEGEFSPVPTRDESRRHTSVGQTRTST